MVHRFHCLETIKVTTFQVDLQNHRSIMTYQCIALTLPFCCTILYQVRLRICFSGVVFVCSSLMNISKNSFCVCSKHFIYLHTCIFLFALPIRMHFHQGQLRIGRQDGRQDRPLGWNVLPWKAKQGFLLTHKDRNFYDALGIFRILCAADDNHQEYQILHILYVYNKLGIQK